MQSLAAKREALMMGPGESGCPTPFAPHQALAPRALGSKCSNTRRCIHPDG